MKGERNGRRMEFSIAAMFNSEAENHCRELSRRIRLNPAKSDQKKLNFFRRSPSSRWLVPIRVHPCPSVVKTRQTKITKRTHFNLFTNP